MKILALDSSGLVASVAYLEDGKIKGLININYQKTHSQTLLPMLDEMVKTLEIDLNDIDLKTSNNIETDSIQNINGGVPIHSYKDIATSINSKGINHK